MKHFFSLEVYKQRALRHALIFVILNLCAGFVIGATVPLIMRLGIAIEDWKGAVVVGLQYFAQFFAPLGVVLLVSINLGQEFEQKTIVQQRLRGIPPPAYLISKFVCLVGAVVASQVLNFWIPGLLLLPAETWPAHTTGLIAIVLHDAWLVGLTMLFVCLTGQSLGGLLASTGFLLVLDWVGSALLNWIGAAFGRPVLSMLASLSPWFLAREIANPAATSMLGPALLLICYAVTSVVLAIVVLRRKEYATI